MTPRAFVDEMSARFREAWPKLEVEPTTSSARPSRATSELRAGALERRSSAERGDIYLGDVRGLVLRRLRGATRPRRSSCSRATSARSTEQARSSALKEETYFFRLSKYAEAAPRSLRATPGVHRARVAPQRGAELRRGRPQGSVSVSRTSFTWGIPVPGDPKHVMYVWFDALANYWTRARQDGDSAQRFWAPNGEVVHLVGKDILRFHAVYWPAFLMSAGAAACRRRSSRTASSPSTGRR